MSAKSQPAGIAFRKHDHSRCQRAAQTRIRALFESQNLRLTQRRREVLEILLASHQPLGAYDILELMNRSGEGARVAPPIVYRALDFLMQAGVIHRIESKNAYISCASPGHQHGAQPTGASVGVDRDRHAGRARVGQSIVSERWSRGGGARRSSADRLEVREGEHEEVEPIDRPPFSIEPI